MSPAGWTDFLEERFGRWSVPHLVRGLVAMNAASWLLNLASPGFLAILKLEPTLILQGEWWRALTFIFVPPASAHPIGASSLLFNLLFISANVIFRLLHNKILWSTASDFSVTIAPPDS